MGALKLCTWNIEWMTSFFGATTDAGWLAAPKIVKRFPGKRAGSIVLAPIRDVHGLCRRIAAGIRAVDPDVLLVQEGPPLRQQMERFVATFLDDAYVTHRSNRSDQAIHALVRREIAADVAPWLPDGSREATLWRDVPYYPWGAVAPAERRKHSLARYPLLLRARLAGDRHLIVGGVHLKSKFSKLKTLQQWEGRADDPEPVLDALGSRQKLSAEVARLRAVLTSVLAVGPSLANVVVAGDFNDGPFRDLLEEEFIVKSILDELVGSFLDPNTYFKHAMEPAVLSSAATTRFPDPLRGGAIVEELIDHVLVSPAIWSGLGTFRIKPGSCQVEEAAWQLGVVGDAEASRDDRPSDHKPVSVVIEW